MTTPLHETRTMPDISGIFLLVAPPLEYEPTILEDFILLNCRQIVTGTYPRVLQELAVKVVASLEGLDKDGGLMSAIVEWGAQPQDLRRIGLLIGPLPADYKELELIKNWDVPQSWVHVHIKLNK
jgi:hypothetical protein